ncbi:MAG: DNA-directed RNA polymerase subunit H [Candidatus Diapherotrites archaeon]
MLKSIAEHHLVPRHELLTKEDAHALLKQFGLDFDKLPRISVDDPMVVELKGNVDDVIRITRNSPVAGETLYYRRVVHA